MLFNFYAIDNMILSDASMLNKMSPFFVIIFSFIFFKERLTAFQGFTVLCAFIGSLFIIKPSFSNVEFLPALLGFLGGMGAGLAYTCVRYLGQHGEKRSVYRRVFFRILLSFLPAIHAYGFSPDVRDPTSMPAGCGSCCGRRTVRNNSRLYLRSCKGDLGLRLLPAYIYNYSRFYFLRRYSG